MLPYAELNIRYEVKSLVDTIDFYHILLGEAAAELYPEHAIYTIKNLNLPLNFVENPATDKPVYSNFNLILHSDNDVYERFTNFKKVGFAKAIKIEQGKFSPYNHTFSIKDPNGICWKLSIKEKRISPFNFFKIPRVNSVWDILKPL